LASLTEAEVQQLALAAIRENKRLQGEAADVKIASEALNRKHAETLTQLTQIVAKAGGNAADLEASFKELLAPGQTLSRQIETGKLLTSVCAAGAHLAGLADEARADAATVRAKYAGGGGEETRSEVFSRIMSGLGGNRFESDFDDPAQQNAGKRTRAGGDYIAGQLAQQPQYPPQQQQQYAPQQPQGSQQLPPAPQQQQYAPQQQQQYAPPQQQQQYPPQQQQQQQYPPQQQQQLPPPQQQQQQQPFGQQLFHQLLATVQRGHGSTDLAN
jgi:hypothetical protein